MASEPSDADLRREVDERSRQLTELDVMLEDYLAERARLIRELRSLQERLREAKELARPPAKDDT
jgi:regulator of replication initiation timing